MFFDVNGKPVFACTGGKEFDNGKPVIIFLHGSGLDHAFWSLYTSHFALKNYTVLALDLPGHTHSTGPQLTRIEAMSDWLNDVVTALDTNSVSLVGHSQGCLIALEYGHRFPQTLRSVSLIASGLATPVNPALIEAAQNDPEAAYAMMMSWSFAQAPHLQQGSKTRTPMRAGGKEVMRGDISKQLAADLIACNSYQNGAVAAAGITCPCQVILGGQDRMAPNEAGMGLVKGLSDGHGAPQLDIIERSGHMIPLEAPDECRDLLEKFIVSNNPGVNH